MSVKTLVSNYIDAERKLLFALEELEGFGSECKCKDREIIRTIHEGNFPEIETLCINCGGVVESL